MNFNQFAQALVNDHRKNKKIKSSKFHYEKLSKKDEQKLKTILGEDDYEDFEENQNCIFQCSEKLDELRTKAKDLREKYDKDAEKMTSEEEQNYFDQMEELRWEVEEVENELADLLDDDEGFRNRLDSDSLKPAAK